VISRLLRIALSGTCAGHSPGASAEEAGVAGFRPFAAVDQKLVTNEQVDRLRDQEGV
jgi:hypothetical protein